MIRPAAKSLAFFKALPGAFDDAVTKHAIPYLNTVARDYAESVKSLMGVFASGGPYGWAALSKTWLEEKAASGLRSEIWTATGETQAAVQAYPVEAAPFGGGYSVFSGIQGSSSGDTDTNLVMRAIRVEFGMALGSAGHGTMIEPRPLFTSKGYELKAQIESASLLGSDQMSQSLKKLLTSIGDTAFRIAMRKAA